MGNGKNFCCIAFVDWYCQSTRQWFAGKDLWLSEKPLKPWNLPDFAIYGICFSMGHSHHYAPYNQYASSATALKLISYMHRKFQFIIILSVLYNTWFFIHKEPLFTALELLLWTSNAGIKEILTFLYNFYSFLMTVNHISQMY